MLNKSLFDPAAPLVKVPPPNVFAVPVSEVAMLLPARPLLSAVSVSVDRPAVLDPVAAETEVLTGVLLE